MKLGKKPNNYYGFAWELRKDDYRHPKFKEQRKERGFDDTETWCLDSTITSFVLPRLERFKELNICLWIWPDKEAGITEEMARKETDEILDKMIAAFQYMHDETNSFEPEPDYVQEGLQLFALHFRRLWW